MLQVNVKARLLLKPYEKLLQVNFKASLLLNKGWLQVDFKSSLLENKRDEKLLQVNV